MPVSVNVEPESEYVTVLAVCVVELAEHSPPEQVEEQTRLTCCIVIDEDEGYVNPLKEQRMKSDRRSVAFPWFIFMLFSTASIPAYAVQLPTARYSIFANFLDQGSSASGATGSGAFGLTGQLVYGAGILLSANIAPMLELELGDTLSISGGSVSAMETPILVRYYFNRFLSIGAGGYGLDVIGSGWGAGAEGSLGLLIPIAGPASFLVDGRIRYGLVVLSGPSSFSDTGLEALTGLSFKF